MSVEHPLAPRWRRLVSLCYESLLLLAVILVAGMLFQLLFSRLAGTPAQFAFLILVLYGYFAWCWRRSGQTLAMKTWRLQLRNRANQLPSLWQVSLRFALCLLVYAPLIPLWAYTKHVPDMKWLLWLGLAWMALPWLWALIDREQQCLHDRLSGIRVVLLPIHRAD